MQKYSTTVLVHMLQQETETMLNQAVGEWQMLPHAIMTKQPKVNSWSAAQCLEHLNSYGRYYLPVIEKAIELSKEKGLTAKETFAAGWLGDYFTNLMKPGKKMKKMSAPKNHTPAPQVNATEAVAAFIDQQEKMLLLLEQAKHVDLEKTKCAISIAKFIKLKLGDTFRFLVAHNQRHVQQAERAIKSAKGSSNMRKGNVEQPSANLST